MSFFDVDPAFAPWLFWVIAPLVMVISYIISTKVEEPHSHVAFAGAMMSLIAIVIYTSKVM